MTTRMFTVAELAALGVPPDSPEDVEYSETLLADEHVRVLKYSQQRRAIFRTNGGIWAVEYEAPIDTGDFEVGADGTDGHGWHGDTVEATAVVRCEVKVLRWLPIEEDQGERDWGQDVRAQQPLADPKIRYLADLIADVVNEADANGHEIDADHDGPGRILATLDGHEYMITIAPNTEGASTRTAPPVLSADGFRRGLLEAAYGPVLDAEADGA